MRKSGLAQDARGLSRHDHLCWRYDEPAEFRSRMREFVAEGLALGQRVCYVATGTAEALTDELREVVGMDQALLSGAAQVTSVGGTCAADTAIEPSTPASTPPPPYSAPPGRGRPASWRCSTWTPYVWSR
ncbi:MEDS domain-containing protein [Halopolyspora algeriensis]|nr:MEDS domain-containing protein [Halopolyspora algeriensis]